MQKVARIPTKYSEHLTVGYDEDRDEVIIHDAFGETHRLTREQCYNLRDALLEANVRLNCAAAERG